MGADWIENTLDWIHTQTKRKRSGSWSETRQKGAGSGSPQQGARGGIRGQSEGGVLGMSGGSEPREGHRRWRGAMGEVGRTRRGSRARWGGGGEIPEVYFEVSEGVRAWLMPVRFASTGTSEQEEREEEHLHFVSAEALGREHGRRSGRPPSQL